MVRVKEGGKGEGGAVMVYEIVVHVIATAVHLKKEEGGEDREKRWGRA